MNNYISIMMKIKKSDIDIVFNVKKICKGLKDDSQLS